MRRFADLLVANFHFPAGLAEGFRQTQIESHPAFPFSSPNRIFGDRTLAEPLNNMSCFVTCQSSTFSVAVLTPSLLSISFVLMAGDSDVA
jgi:hypothetical protein